MRIALAAAVCCLPTLAWAQDTSVHAYYAAYSNGLNIIDIDAQLQLGPRDYRIEIAYHTTGLVGLLVHLDGSTRAIGRFGASRPEPRQMFSSGHIRGVLHVTQLDYVGGQPHTSQMIPPIADDNRDPVPEADQANTVDSLSAMAQLMHQVAASGKCDGTLNTFDGRRLADLTAHAVGMETLAPTGRSNFSGPALRCDFVGHQRGGWIHDVDRAELERPQYGSAWFASVRPGEPPIPVRFEFKTRFYGPTTAYIATPP